jgi:Carboxypeptidase regulatory-like domain
MHPVQPSCASAIHKSFNSREGSFVNHTPARLSTYIVVLLSFSIALIAQNTASVSGTITDQTGKPVATAKISLKNVSTGQMAGTKSDSMGNYSFNSLAPGQYELSASAEGLAAKTITVSLTTPAQRADIALASTGPSLSDLGFNPSLTQSNPEEQARLDRRTRMLKIHQKMGLITAGPLAATIITGFGAGGKRTSSGTRDFHAALGSATAGLYFTTAYFAICAPKIEGTHTRGPIRVHKTLAWIHGPGMILTPILGAMAFDQKSKGEKIHGIARLHGPVAIVTGAAFGAALLSVSVKF